MAIELKNRKRKLKVETNIVPSKKKSNPPAEEQHTAEENIHTTTNDISFEADNTPTKFPKDFKMLAFRTKLRGQNFMNDLRHLIHLADIKPQIIRKYIDKRGKPLELAEALERVDKTNIFHVFYVCQALQLVLMEILTNHKVHMESAVQACQYFLKSHGAVIENLLKSNNLNHRKCALKLCTAIVCVEPQLGRQLVTFETLTNVKAIESFFSHSKEEFSEGETVRKCFIHFIMAFLVNGNILLIRTLLDKNILVKALVGGLVFDDEVTVSVVLSTLKQYVLESVDISKTKKIHVFDVDCIKSFVKLYDWLGPKALAAKFASKLNSESKNNIIKLNKYTDPDAKKTVSCAAHEFLLMLLTSRKYGIAFDTMLHFQQRRNKTQGKIIGFLDKPWLCEKKTELIIEILKACPELARQTVRHYGALINPLRTPVHMWVVICNFLAKIIAELHPRLLRNALEKISLTDFSYWIKDICLPLEVLMHITGSRVLKHTQYQHRLAANRLLLAMFSQYANYMDAITNREKQKNNNLRKFRFDILNHVLLNFPTIEDILFSLYETIKCQEEDGVDVLEHLDVTLDLVLIICKQNRSFVNKTGVIMDYLNLLRPLYSGDGENIKLELKAIKAILMLFPKALEPHAKLFENVLKSFVKAFICGKAEVKQESGELLRGIFLNTGIFDTGELEIDLWLEALNFVDPHTVDIVTCVFIEVLQVSGAKIHTESIENTVQIENKQISALFSNIEMGLSVQGYVETLRRSKLYALIISGVEVGPELKIYLELVDSLLLHYTQADVEIYNMQADNVLKIIPHLSKIQMAVLNGQIMYKEIFDTETTDQNYRLIMIYIQGVVSMITRLVKNKKFSLEQSNSAADFMIQLLDAMQNICSANNVEVVTSEDSEHELEFTYLEKNLNYIFNSWLNMIPSTNILNIDSWYINYISCIQKIVSFASTLNINKFSEITLNCRKKIKKSVEISILESKEHTKNRSDDLNVVISLIESFQLPKEDCVEILEKMSSLSFSDFVTQSGRKSIFFDILIICLKRISDLQQCVNCDGFIAKISQLYIYLKSTLEIDLGFDDLEDVCYNFLLICHQYIPQISLNVFPSIFQHKKITKPTIRLVCLFLERSPQLEDIFRQALPLNITKKEIIYPLLNVAVANGIYLDKDLLNSIYQEFKNGFMKTIEKPHKAGVIYKENVKSSIYLIESCMPKSECIDFCNKNIKFDSVETFQIIIIRAIFRKALSSVTKEMDEVFLKIRTQYVCHFIQMLNIVLKKDSLDENKIDLISFSLFDWLRNSSQLLNTEISSKSYNWLNTYKSILKAGMHISESKDSDADRINGKLLKILAFLCDQFYEDNSDNSEAGQLYNMIFTHSKFHTIILQVHPNNVKTQIMHLLFILAKKCVSCLESEQIASILGAYQAKLTDCDRFTLALLQIFEESEIGLHQYRPFIWGESAVAFYSLRDDLQEKTNLEHQETTVAQVMSLIDFQVSQYTLNCFPIWRKLDHKSQLPKMIFDDPDSSYIRSFGTNFIERSIEQGITEFEEAELRICPKGDNAYDECYDPAFIVPLMSMCFAPEIYSHPVRPVQNGLLSLVFASLSSLDKDMRMAAGCVQLRYRQHFENSKFFEKPLWVQAYENIQSGLNELRNDWLKHRKNSGIPRVPYIPCLFLAKTINITTDPTDILYKQLTMFLRLKDTFNFLCIPEFNVLFHSSEVEHHTLRQFIVDVIRYGIKNSSDLFLLVSNNTFKALLGFYGSHMSTLDINLLILSVLSTCVKIPGSSKIMIEHVGIIPWMDSVLATVEFYQFDIIEGIISIINNLWFSVRANAKQFHNIQHIYAQIHRLIQLLYPKLSARISINALGKLLNISNKTIEGHIHQFLSEEQLDRLLTIARKICDEKNIQFLYGLKEYGSLGAESRESFHRRYEKQNVDASVTFFITNLREIVLNWHALNKMESI